MIRPQPYIFDARVFLIDACHLTLYLAVKRFVESEERKGAIAIRDGGVKAGSRQTFTLHRRDSLHFCSFKTDERNEKVKRNGCKNKLEGSSYRLAAEVWFNFFTHFWLCKLKSKAKVL